MTGCGGNDTEVFEMIEPVSIVPMPQESGYTTNSFTLNPDTRIYCSEEVVKEAEFLRSLINDEFGYEIEIVREQPESNFIRLTLGQLTGDGYSGDEAYEITISPDTFNVAANTKTGLLWGLQTLHQTFNQTDHQDGYAARIQGMYVKDYPKFTHRGLLLDCCRHFFSKKVVKKYIELLSYYKMNVLHWHLTEDQGWRIEIDKYPKLTEIGAWRTEADGSEYGGFYSKADIREIVAYAEDLNVTIIPEIELPGHSQAAIAAYPNLSCEQKPVPVANDWGVFKEIYCAGNDSTFVFLENVLTEVMELFPSEYIHIGGDEAPKYRWEHCSKCQHRIKEEDLKDEHELQSYFIGRIEKFLNENGRELIGWDEILEGGLSPHATVQSWRGMEGGIHAAEHGHYAIMSPTSHCYIDYSLDAINLEKVYSFNPIPDSLKEEQIKFILGGEVNMWTEHVPNEKDLDSKVFPRMLALSEVLWSGPGNNEYKDFRARVYDHFEILDSNDVAYGAEAIPLSMYVKGDSAYLQAEVPEVKLKYCVLPGDGTAKADYLSSQSYALETYMGPVFCNRDVEIRGVAMLDSSQYGKGIRQQFCKKIEVVEDPVYQHSFSDSYNGGGTKGLVDGKLGSLNFRDGNWQGFRGKNLIVTIELKEGQTINEVSANFYHYNNSWIFRPEQMVVAVSDDGINWPKVGLVKPAISQETRGKHIENLLVKLSKPMSPRYLRIHAFNVNKVPDWHEAAGSDAWLFVDEIRVK